MVLSANIFMKIRLCNGEMLFLSPICQAVLLIFCWNAVKSTDRLIRACIGHFGAACIMRQYCQNR